MPTFLEKHPKLANALGEAGKIIAPICEAAGNIPGFQLLGNIGNGIDKLENISDAKKAELKDIAKQEMAENDELEGLMFKDKDSARQRDTIITTSEKAPLLSKLELPMLATFVTLGFFGILTYMLFRDVPASNKDILNVMLGSLGTAWLSIVGYYFGSSAGSKDKDSQISKLIENNN